MHFGSHVIAGISYRYSDFGKVSGSIANLLRSATE